MKPPRRQDRQVLIEEVRTRTAVSHLFSLLAFLASWRFKTSLGGIEGPFGRRRILGGDSARLTEDPREEAPLGRLLEDRSLLGDHRGDVALAEVDAGALGTDLHVHRALDDAPHLG